MIIGTSKTINCSVTGLPPPSVQWKRLTPGNNSKLANASIGYSLLKFDPFEETDAGQYICTASYLDVDTNWTISVNVSDGKLNSFFVFRFQIYERKTNLFFVFKSEVRKTKYGFVLSFFVFLTSLFETKNEKLFVFRSQV